MFPRIVNKRYVFSAEGFCFSLEMELLVVIFAILLLYIVYPLAIMFGPYRRRPAAVASPGFGVNGRIYD